jgi:sugar-specific transcriptional regulator TrmB
VVRTIICVQRVHAVVRWNWESRIILSKPAKYITYSVKDSLRAIAQAYSSLIWRKSEVDISDPNCRLYNKAPGLFQYSSLVICSKEDEYQCRYIYAQVIAQPFVLMLKGT